MSQTWLARLLEHRIGDERIVRLVLKWLKVGLLEDGEWSVSEAGTPQGEVISPLLANIYLHYVFDLWARRWRRRGMGRAEIFNFLGFTLSKPLKSSSMQFS